MNIILCCNHLSGEFKFLLENCLHLNPHKLFVNTINEKVIEYIMNNYHNHNGDQSKNQVIIMQYTNYSTLKELMMIYTHSHSNDYPNHGHHNHHSRYYIAIDTVDPILDYPYLKSLLKEFKKSDKDWGYLYNKLSQEFCLADTNDNLILNTINQKILFYHFQPNQPSQPKTFHYMLTEHSLEYHPRIRLANKTILITGILGGIGIEIAKKYHTKGWRVLGVDRDKEAPEEKYIYIDKYYQIDLSNERQIKKRIKKLLKNENRLDMIVHSAALQVNNSLVQTSSHDWDKVMSINLKSIWLICQLAHSHLKDTQGNVVVINSIHAFATSINIGAYAISKAALLGFVRNLAVEWGVDGIRVNGIAPGAIETPMLIDGLGRRGNDPQDELNMLKKRHLMGNIGKPYHIANTIYFLGKSQFMTGETLIIDGGVSQILSTEAKIL